MPTLRQYYTHFPTLLPKSDYTPPPSILAHNQLLFHMLKISTPLCPSMQKCTHFSTMQFYLKTYRQGGGV
jgi:hypothetical protein